MSGPYFPISYGKSYFYEPRSCATDVGHIVSYLKKMDESLMNELWIQVLIDGETSSPTKLGNFDDSYHISLFDQYSTSKYVLMLNNNSEYSLYIITNRGVLVETIEMSSDDIILACKFDGNNTILFLYNYDNQTFSTGVIPKDGRWEELEIIETYPNVYGTPTILWVGDDNYFATWVNINDDVEIIYNNVYSDSEVRTTVKDCGMMCLAAARVNKTTVVIGGYDNAERKLKLNYCRVEGNEIQVISRYSKSSDYKNMICELYSLENGFMLVAEGVDYEAIWGQRFTHVGGWLYPLSKLDSSDFPTWSPHLSHNPNTGKTLLVYLMDFSDTDNRVCGKWIHTGPIPELENLELNW